MNQNDELMDMLTRKEELDDELKPWIVEGGMFGTSLKHPLVFVIGMDPSRSAHANSMLRHKKAALDKAVAEEDGNKQCGDSSGEEWQWED